LSFHSSASGSAGFLRVMDGEQPLDASGVHPEAYPVVARILAESGRGVQQIIGDGAFLRALKPDRYTDEKFGLPTVRDILKELEKPGRDPRPSFEMPSFTEGVEDLADLKPGMVLEGRVSNVAAFGAFVDIGVHQDGLVHVSALSSKFVKDPRDVVKAGDVVKVKVLEVDLARKRIALTMRLDDAATPGASGSRSDAGNRPGGGGAGQRRDGSSGSGQRRDGGRGMPPKPAPAPASNAFADAFAKARRS